MFPRFPGIRALADLLVAELRRRDIDTAHVAGNSLGGWLAVELGRRGFARSITALSPAGGWKNADAHRTLIRQLLTAYRLTPIVYVLAWLFMGIGAVRKALSADTMVRGDRVPLSEFRAILRAFMGCKMMPRLFGNTRAEDGVQRYSDISVPVCVAWSESDRVLPFEEHGRSFLERMPNARREIVPQAGHVPMYDAPR